MLNEDTPLACYMELFAKKLGKDGELVFVFRGTCEGAGLNTQEPSKDKQNLELDPATLPSSLHTEYNLEIEARDRY